MKRLLVSFVRYMLLAVVVSMIGLSAVQLMGGGTAKAQNCSGLTCDNGSQCGTKCFCAKSGNCVVDAGGGIGPVGPVNQ
jgi:hypothetical protein